MTLEHLYWAAGVFSVLFLGFGGGIFRYLLASDRKLNEINSKLDVANASTHGRFEVIEGRVERVESDVKSLREGHHEIRNILARKRGT